MEHVILAPYRVLHPTTLFPHDFWVLSRVVDQLLIETEEGTYIVQVQSFERALKNGLIACAHEL